MNNKNYYWPLQWLGPKILSKRELLEGLMAYQLWQNSSISTFQEGADEYRKSILKYKESLNTQYSYLKRLKLSSEADKLYSGYTKKYEKQLKKQNSLKKNIETNNNTLENILDTYPNLFKRENMLQFYNVEPPYLAPLKSKNVWISTEIIVIKNNIETLKRSIKNIEQELNKKINKYNKLKKRIVI